jgi:hypothetical protein
MVANVSITTELQSNFSNEYLQHSQFASSGAAFYSFSWKPGQTQQQLLQAKSQKGLYKSIALFNNMSSHTLSCTWACSKLNLGIINCK